jgi:ferredoxin
MKKFPVIYNLKEECCGCTACYAICPKNAISMVEDEEGFEYPQVDENKCVGCCLCLKVCPFKVATDSGDM